MRSIAGAMLGSGLDGDETSMTVLSGESRPRAAASPCSSFIAEERTEEERFLLGSGFSKPLVAAMKRRARRNGTTIEVELLASGQVREDVYYESFARFLGVPFLGEVDPSHVVDSDMLDGQLLHPSILRLVSPSAPSLTVVVPKARHVADWRRRLEEMEDLRRTLAITTPSALRRAVWRAGAPRRAATAADRLFETRPDLSARSVLTGGQGFLAGFLATAFFFSLLLAFEATLQAFHVLLSGCFFILIALRALATRRMPRPAKPSPMARDSHLPVYTVLVALYREKEVAPQLVASLLRLDWPHSRLDIKLICEAGDRETIGVFSAMDLPPHFEVVEVPDGAPRTKPRALNYGLAGARGDYS